MVSDAQVESLLPANGGHDSTSERVPTASVIETLRKGGEQLSHVEGVLLQVVGSTGTSVPTVLSTQVLSRYCCALNSAIFWEESERCPGDQPCRGSEL